MENNVSDHQASKCTFNCQLSRFGYAHLSIYEPIDVREFLWCDTYDEVLEELEEVLKEVGFPTIEDFDVDEKVLEPAKGFKEAWERLKKEQNDSN